MELLLSNHMEKGETTGGVAMRGAGSAAAVPEQKNDYGVTVLTKDQRIEKGRFMNRVANMNPERRMKKLLSDRYANMSAERRAKKKESNRILNRPENMSLARKMRKRLSDSAAHMSDERKEKKKESQRKRNLLKVKVPRLPLSGEKRDLKNEKGKMRRAAKKATAQSIEDAAFIEMAVAAGFTPTAIIHPGPRSAASSSSSSSFAAAASSSSSSSAAVSHVLINQVSDVVADIVSHLNTQPDTAADSDSDKDDDDIADNHNTATVPVDDESDLTNLHNALNTLPLLDPLPPLSTLPIETAYPEETDYLNSSTHPLSRKRNRPAKDL